MPVASVGDTADATMTVTHDDIEAYADLVGDTNPIHVDDDYAEDTMFDGRVAHGMLSAGVVSAALADLDGDVVYLSQDLQFEAPVRPNDTVTARAEVVEDLGNDQLRVRTTVTTGEAPASDDHASDDDVSDDHASDDDVSDDHANDQTTVLSGHAVVMSVPHKTTTAAACDD